MNILQDKLMKWRLVDFFQASIPGHFQRQKEFLTHMPNFKPKVQSY